MKKFVAMLLVVVMVAALFATIAMAARGPVDKLIDAIKFNKETETFKSGMIFNAVMNLFKGNSVIRFVQGIVNEFAFPFFNRGR